MQVKLQKIGNSHMITIPATIVKNARLKAGISLEIKEVDKSLVINVPQKEEKKIGLSDIKPMFKLRKKMSKKDFKDELKEIKQYRYDKKLT